jgi:Thiamine pyrophosphate enzyme, N-terminal TPP binding domain
MGPEESNIGRRNFLQMTGAGIVAASAGATATQAVASNQSADSEFSDGIVPQPAPQFAPDLTTADIMIETLISWGATHCFGVVGDGINSIIEALRKRQDQIKYIGVRHEQAHRSAWHLRRHHGARRRPPSQRSLRRAHGWRAGRGDYWHDVS